MAEDLNLVVLHDTNRNEDVLPITHEDAVLDSEGKSIGTKLSEAKESLQTTIDNRTVICSAELFDINKTAVVTGNASYMTNSVDTTEGTITFNHVSKVNSVFGPRFTLPMVANKTYRLRFDWTNGINTVTEVVIRDSSNTNTLYSFSNVTLPKGSGSFDKTFTAPSGAFYLEFFINLNVTAGNTLVISNISLIETTPIINKLSTIENDINAVESLVDERTLIIGEETFDINNTTPASNTTYISSAVDTTLETITFTNVVKSDSSQGPRFTIPSLNAGVRYRIEFDWVNQLNTVTTVRIMNSANNSVLYTFTGVTLPLGNGHFNEVFIAPPGAYFLSFVVNINVAAGRTLTFSNISIKTEETVKGKISSLSNKSGGGLGVVTLNVPMEVGKISPSGDYIGYNTRVDSNWDFYRNSGFIRVSEGSYDLRCTNKGGTLVVFRYNSNREYISMDAPITMTADVSYTVNVGSGTSFIRLNFENTTDTFMPRFTIHGNLSKEYIAKFGIHPQAISSNCENFLVETWYQSMGSTNSTTNSVQDVPDGTTEDWVGWKKNRGMIQLPEDYDPDGEPTRLIIYCHGGGPVTTSTYVFSGSSTGFDTELHVNPMVFVKEGYAIMDMDCRIYTDAEAHDVLTERAYNCYKAGYEYVLRNYNIRTDGILLAGRSNGGHRGLILLQSDLPIIACSLVDPYIGPSCIYSTYHRKYLGESHMGMVYEGDIWTTQVSMTDAEWNALQNNYGKFLRSNALLRACNVPSKEVVFDETIYSFRNADCSYDSYNSEWDTNVLSKWSAKFKAPIKIFQATNDAIAKTNRHARLLYNVCQNGGGICELRLFDNVTNAYSRHYPEIRSTAILMDGYVTKYGETLNGVAVIYAEMIKFFRRYEQ